MLLSEVKTQFPALQDATVVYLDNAATTQLPEVVMQAMLEYERGGRGNPGRGLHAFGERATLALAAARARIAQFIGASEASQVIFTKSTTEGLNWLAQSLGREFGPGDEVVLTIFEHHANLLPWRILAAERGFTLKFLAQSQNGAIDLEAAKRIITSSTKALVVTQVSNVTGVILPVKELASLAHAVGAIVIVDAAQAVGHLPVNVGELDCDALVFGGHKMYGPEGIGAVYLASSLSSRVRPWLYGGGMAAEVWGDELEFVDGVQRFEAGSPNVTGVVGLAAACDFLSELGLANIQKHEQELTRHLLELLTPIPRVQVHRVAGASEYVGIVSFSVAGVHPHDVAQILADNGVAVRAGYHCAAPIARCLHEAGTVRVSLGVYSCEQDLQRLVEALKLVLIKFGV